MDAGRRGGACRRRAGVRDAHFRRCHRACHDVGGADLARCIDGAAIALRPLSRAGGGRGVRRRRLHRRPDAHADRCIADETEFRDGVHGVLVWAIAMVLTVLLTWAAAQSLTRLAAPSGGPSGTAQSVAGENIIAYRSRPSVPRRKRPQNADLTYARSEAARILLTTAGHRGIASDDRAYLVRLTAANTGLARRKRRSGSTPSSRRHATISARHGARPLSSPSWPARRRCSALRSLGSRPVRAAAIATTPRRR